MRIASSIKISEAIEAFIASVIKSTPEIEESDKPAIFKSANRYSNSWLATGETKCDNNTPPTKE